MRRHAHQLADIDAILERVAFSGAHISYVGFGVSIQGKQKEEQ